MDNAARDDLLKHATTFCWTQEGTPEWVEISKTILSHPVRPWRVSWPDPEAPRLTVDHPLYSLYGKRYPFHPLTEDYRTLERAYERVQEILETDPGKAGMHMG